MDIFELTGGVKRNLVSRGTLDSIDQSHRARLNGRAELFRELRRKTAHALGVDKEAYVRGICEGVEHHLWSSDSRPAYRTICALHSTKPIPRCTAVRVEGGGFLTEESEVKSRCAGYFERLYQADAPAVELDVRGVTIPIADTQINCDLLSFVETQAAVNRMKCVHAPGLYGIHIELFKAAGNAVLVSLHAVLCSAWNTGIIPTDWKRGLLFPLWKGVIVKTATTTEG